jgi:putative PEP-CTERM system TPR-repeat lipoprotein
MKRCESTVVQVIAVMALMAGCNLSVDPQRAIAKAQEYRLKGDNKAAIIEIKNILQKNSNHAEARYWLGVTYYDSRDYRSAEQELRRALDLSYERSKVMPMLGKTMLMLGDFQKVLDQVPLEAHAGNAVQAEILTLRARALMGLGRSSQARELLEVALGKQPEFADALIEQARLAAAEKKLDESVRLIERAILSAPKHADAWLMKGDLARASANEADAMAAYQKVIEFDPANIAARLNVTSLHIANNKLSEARKLIAQTRAIDPASVTTAHMQALVEYQARDYKAANDAILQVLKAAPNYLPSVVLAGAILTELGSYEQAQQHIGRALDQMPDNIYVRRLMVVSLARSGQMPRAIEVLQAALKQAPGDSQVVALAGELHLQSGEFAKAAAYFDMAAARDPNDAAARVRLAVSRMASGAADRAIADLELATKLDSNNYQADMLLVASHLKRGNYDRALNAMASLEKKQPKNPVIFNLKAGILHGMKDIPNARENFERALELQPTFLAAAVNLAQLDILDRNLKSARGRLEAILEKDKSNVSVLIALSELGPALGATTQERVGWLERARKANPQAVAPPQMIISLYLEIGETTKALEVAQQAHLHSPGNPQLIDLLGATQLNAGEKERALVSFRNLVQVQPKSPAALYRLASAQTYTSDDDSARETLKKALSLSPDFGDAQLALVSLEIRARRYADALNIARQAQKQNPKSPFGFALEGQVWMGEKKFSQAIKSYEAAHGMAKNATSLINLCSAYVAAGNADEGSARLTQWLKESPDDTVVRLYAAETALKRGGFKEAIAHYELLRKTQPDNVLLLNNLAWAYYQLKDARALETAEHAYKLKPGNVSIADTLGWLLIEQGNTSRGIEVLTKAVKTASNNPSVRYHLAQGWLKVGEKSKAREELERLLAIKGKFSVQEEAKTLLKQIRD